MRRNLILFLGLFIFVAILGCRSQPNQWQYNDYQSQTTDIYQLRGELLQAHNARRDGQLRMDRSLEAAAQRHAEWMARKEKLSHTGENGSDMQDRVGPTSFRRMGENIAYGYTTIDEVMNAWMRSSGHKRNIQNKSYTHVGFGVAYSENGTPYYCAVFGG